MVPGRAALYRSSRHPEKGFGRRTLANCPDHIYAEIGNTLWKRTNAGTIAVTDAQDFISDFLRIKIILVLTANLLSDAYQLAITYKRSMYDSLYLALSQREQYQFVTADEKLVNAVGSAMSNVVLLANWS